MIRQKHIKTNITSHMDTIEPEFVSNSDYKIKRSIKSGTGSWIDDAMAVLVGYSGRRLLCLLPYLSLYYVIGMGPGGGIEMIKRIAKYEICI